MPDIDRFRGQVQGDIRNSQVARAINQVSNQTNRQGFTAAVGVQNNYQPITTAQEFARSGANVLSGGAQSFSQSVGSAASVTFRATQSMLRDLTRVRNTMYSPDISQISSRFTPIQTPPSRMGLFESARVASGLFMQSPRGMLKSEYQRGAARSLRERFTSAGRELGLFAVENAPLALGLIPGLLSAPVMYPAMGRIREEYNQRDQVRNLLRRTSWRYMRGKNFTEDQLSDISQSFVNVARENQEIATGDVSRLAYTATKMGVFDTVRGPEQAKKEFQKFIDKVIKLSTKLEESVDQAAARLASKNPSLISPDIYGGIARATGLTTQELNRAGQQGAQAFRGMGFDANFGYDIGVQNLATLRNIQTRNEAGRGLISRMGGLGAANQRTMQAVGQFMQTPQMAMMMGAFANQSGRFDPNRMNQFMQSGGGLRDLMGMFQQNMAQNGGMGWQASLNMNLPQNIEAMGPVAGSTMAVQMLQMVASSNPQWKNMSTEMRKNVMASIAPGFGMDPQAARVMIEGINPEETLAQMREIRENAMRREQLIREKQGSIKAVAGRAWDRFTGGTANVIRGIGSRAVEVGRGIRWAAENSWAVQYNPYVMMGKKALGVSGELRNYFFGDQYEAEGMGGYDLSTDIQSWIESTADEERSTVDLKRAETMSREETRARVRSRVRAFGLYKGRIRVRGYPVLPKGSTYEDARKIAREEVESGRYRVKDYWTGGTVGQARSAREFALGVGRAIETPSGPGVKDVVKNEVAQDLIKKKVFEEGERLGDKLIDIEAMGLDEAEETRRKREAYMGTLRAIQRSTRGYTEGGKGLGADVIYRTAKGVWGSLFTDEEMKEMDKEYYLKDSTMTEYANRSYEDLEEEFVDQMQGTIESMGRKEGVEKNLSEFMGKEKNLKAFQKNFFTIERIADLQEKGMYKEAESLRDEAVSAGGFSQSDYKKYINFYKRAPEGAMAALRPIRNNMYNKELTSSWKEKIGESELNNLEDLSKLRDKLKGKDVRGAIQNIERFATRLKEGRGARGIIKEISENRGLYTKLSARLRGMDGEESEGVQQLIGLAMGAPENQMRGAEATGPGAEAINDLRKNTNEMLATLGSVLRNQTNIAKKLQMEIEKK